MQPIEEKESDNSIQFRRTLPSARSSRPFSAYSSNRFNSTQSNNTKSRRPLSASERKQIYDKLATPVSRDFDEISGSVSDQQHCTFTPALSQVSRSKFPSNGDFLNRLQSYNNSYELTRSTTPPLERECTFRPHLYINSKIKSTSQLNESSKAEWATRMSKYHHRIQQAPLEFTFQPELNSKKTKQIQEKLNDNRSFEQRYYDDLQYRKQQQKALAEKQIHTHQPQVHDEKRYQRDGNSISFIARMARDAERRQEIKAARDVIIGVSLPPEPHIRRMNDFESVQQQLSELYHQR